MWAVVLSSCIACVPAHACVHAPRSRCVRPTRVIPAVLCVTEPDIVRINEISAELSRQLPFNDPADADQVTQEIASLHAETLAPLAPKIYMASVPADERKAAIEGLSRSLDVLEEAARGPMLAGGQLSVADALCFPSVALCAQTLPRYFGWSDWTAEALFWKRPRLHAWWELMSYERPCATTKKIIVARLEEIDFSALAIDVPTSRIRTLPKHTC